jgi:zinc transporter 1
MAWSKSTRITVMLVIDITFFLLELGVGLVVGSLALMADAFHMVWIQTQTTIPDLGSADRF